MSNRLSSDYACDAQILAQLRISQNLSSLQGADIRKMMFRLILLLMAADPQFLYFPAQLFVALPAQNRAPPVTGQGVTEPPSEIAGGRLDEQPAKLHPT